MEVVLREPQQIATLRSPVSLIALLVSSPAVDCNPQSQVDASTVPLNFYPRADESPASDCDIITQKELTRSYWFHSFHPSNAVFSLFLHLPCAGLRGAGGISFLVPSFLLIRHQSAMSRS